MKKIGALSKFENMMEQLFEERSIGWLKGQLQPIDLAKRLARTMELNQSIYLDKTTVPNSYTLYLSPSDFQAFEPYQAGLERELAKYVADRANELEVTMRGPVVVCLNKDESLGKRDIRLELATVEPLSMPTAPVTMTQETSYHTARIDRSLFEQQALPRAWLILKNSRAEERRFPITGLPCRLGRSPDNDIVIEDRRASRQHAEIVDNRGKLCLVDLGSTNGTLVNGKTIDKRILRDRDVISLGNLEFVLELGTGS